MSHIRWPFNFTITMISYQKNFRLTLKFEPFKVKWDQKVKLIGNNPSHEMVNSFNNENNFSNTVLWISSFWRKGIKVHLALIIRQSNVSPPIVQSGLIVSLLTLEDMLEVCDLSFFHIFASLFLVLSFSLFCLFQDYSDIIILDRFTSDITG